MFLKAYYHSKRKVFQKISKGISVQLLGGRKDTLLRKLCIQMQERHWEGHRETHIDMQKTETHQVKINTHMNKKNKQIKNFQRDLLTLLIGNTSSLISP